MPNKQEKKNKKMPSRKAFALAREWLALKSGEKHPSGHFDRAGRWYPDEEEWCPRIANIRPPSRAYPYSYLRHCRTQEHFFWKHNLTPEEVKEVRRAIRILRAKEPPLTKLLKRIDKGDIQPLEPAAILPKWLGGPIGAKFYTARRTYDEKEDRVKDVLYSPFVPDRLERGWQIAMCYSPEKMASEKLAKGSPAYERWANNPKSSCGFYAFGDLRDAVVYMLKDGGKNNVLAIVESPPDYVAFWHPNQGWRFATIRLAAIVDAWNKQLAREMAEEYGVPTVSLEEAHAVVLWSTQAFAPQGKNPEDPE